MNTEKRVKINCCIGGCAGERLTTFSPDPLAVRIPTTPFGLRQQWVNIIRASKIDPEWRPAEDSVVCSLHFKTKELLVNPEGTEAELDLESCKNVVPTLRLGDYESVKSDDEDEDHGKDNGELRLLTGPDMTVIPFVKSEPQEAEAAAENDPFEEAGSETGEKKKRRQNRPTWSLKELQLSDDEAGNNLGEEDANSSEYEPTSDSDSDGGMHENEKRRRTSTNTFQSVGLRPVPNLNGIEAVSGGTFRLNSAQLSHRNTSQGLNTPNRQKNGVTHQTQPGKFVLSARTQSDMRKTGTNSSVNAMGIKANGYPSSSDIQLMNKWLVELQSVFRSAHANDFVKLVTYVINKFRTYAGAFSESVEKIALMAQLDIVEDLMAKKSIGGTSTSHDIHFNLRVKKISDVLNAWLKAGLKRKLPNSLIPGSISIPAAGNNPLRTNGIKVTTSHMVPSSAPPSFPRLTRLNQSRPTVSPVQKPISSQAQPGSPEIICIDEEEEGDSMGIQIQSVTTLAKHAQARSPVQAGTTRSEDGKKVVACSVAIPLSSVTARTTGLQLIMENAKKQILPKPVPKDFEDSVTWMGMPSSEWIHVGHFTDKEIAETNNLSRKNITVFPPTLPMGKYQPNVYHPESLFKRGHVRNPFLIAPTFSVQQIAPSPSPQQLLPSKTVEEPDMDSRDPLSLSPTRSSPIMNMNTPTTTTVIGMPPVPTATTIIGISPTAFDTAPSTAPSQPPSNSRKIDEIIILSDSDEDPLATQVASSVNHMNDWNVTMTGVESYGSQNALCTAVEDEILGI